MRSNKAVSTIASYLLPRLGEILFAAVFIAAIGLGPRMMNLDGDLGRHLTLGRYILENRTIPTRDVFSFTKPGDPLTPHEWLSDVIFAAAHELGGFNGVIWLTALVLASSVWIVYRHSLRLSKMSLIALISGILCAAAGSVHWLTRPHIFTILLTALWTFELDRLRNGLIKTWFIFPLLMLLWVNLHGAFIAGFVIWGGVLAGVILEQGWKWSQQSKLILAGLSSFLASLVNPAGLRIWQTALEFLGSKYLVSHTAEYLPPDFQSPAFWPFLVVLGISILILGISRSRLHASSLLLVSGWTLMALYSARNIPLYLVVVLPILSGQLSQTILSGKRGRSLQGWVDLQTGITQLERQIRGGSLTAVVLLGSLALALGGGGVGSSLFKNDFSPDEFPVEAVNWIDQQGIDGEGFNYFPWGGYLLYRMWPEKKVFIDGQTDFYGEELTREYESVITLQTGWEKILSKYGVKWALVPPDSRLAVYLEQSPEWEEVYRDQTAGLYLLEPDQ